AAASARGHTPPPQQQPGARITIIAGRMNAHMNRTITIVGLGSGGEDQLTLGTLKAIEQASHRYVRTNDHPAVRDLRARGIVFDESFDFLYEQHDQFEAVYEAIVSVLIEAAGGAHSTS